MRIRISNVRHTRKGSEKGNLSFQESEEVRGDLEIVFGQDAKPEIFERRDINIPLFIAEARLFFDRLKIHGHGTWRMFFAPFVIGYVAKQKTLLKSSSGETLDILSADQIRQVEELLASMAQAYGCVQPTQEALRESGDYDDRVLGLQ